VNVAPSLAEFDCRYLLTGDTVGGRYFGLRDAGRDEVTNLSHGVIVQFRVRLCRSNGGPALTVTVSVVIGTRSNREMIEPETRRVIATVHNDSVSDGGAAVDHFHDLTVD